MSSTTDHAYVGAHYLSGGATAYAFTGGMLTPIKYFKRTDRNFKKYATAWESLHSKAIFDGSIGAVWPVVDGEGVVVAHYGWFASDEIFVPANLRGGIKRWRFRLRGLGGCPGQ